MTWTRFPVARGNDARPITAGVVTDVVRGNIEHLMDESPAAAYAPITNTAYTSTQAAYNDVSVLVRFPAVIVHPSREGPPKPRDIKWQLFVACSNPAESATFRVWASPSFDIPDATPDDMFATTTVSTSVAAGEWKSSTLSILEENTSEWHYGMALGELPPFYDIVWMGVQAIVTGGATATMSGYFWEERDA